MWALLVGALSSVFSIVIAWFVANSGKIAGSILVYLGFGYITYEFIDIGIDSFISYINTNLAAFPANSLQFVGLLGIDIYLSTILAAYAVLIQIKLLSFGAKLRQVGKPTHLGI